MSPTFKKHDKLISPTKFCSISPYV